MRNKAERRKNDYKHIAKKRKIIKDVYQDRTLVQSLSHQLHRLSKGKVHCSCPICTTKTKKDGPSHSDLKKLAVGTDYDDI